MKYIKVLPVILFFILSYFLFWKTTNIKYEKDLKSALLNKDLPKMSIKILEGNILLSDILGKKSFVLNYFASWCAPCRIEHGVLEKKSKSNIIIGIGYKDSEANIKKFLEELGNPYDAVLLDKSGRAAIDIGLYGVPETYFIDDLGKIRYKQVGPLTEKKFDDIIQLLNK